MTFPFRLCLQPQTGIAWRKLFLPCCMVLGAKRIPRLLVHLPVHLAHISPPAGEAARSVWRPVLGEARKPDQWCSQLPFFSSPSAVGSVTLSPFVPLYQHSNHLWVFHPFLCLWHLMFQAGIWWLACLPHSSSSARYSPWQQLLRDI